MELIDQIDRNQLPKHIAIIMDGNGRWAKAKGKNRIFGHTNGVKSVREISEACAQLGVPYLTLYAFSTENWSRPKTEVLALMNLLLKTLKSELKTLMKNNIRLSAIGKLEHLPQGARKELEEVIEMTKENSRLQMTLALSYSGRQEIVSAVQQIAADCKAGKLNVSDVSEATIHAHLYTRNMPDPELLIRTSNELRISNFLLWQIAYAEFYFTKKFWPEFRKDDLYEAVLDFQKRERRFGKTGEQLKNGTPLTAIK